MKRLERFHDFLVSYVAPSGKYNPDFYMRAINISSAEQDVAACFCCDGDKSQWRKI
jgi:hypothetical protein